MLLYPIFIPLILGLAILIIKRYAFNISFFGAIVTFLAAAEIFLSNATGFDFGLFSFLGINIKFALASFRLNSFVLLAISFFTLLIIIYSLKFFEDERYINEYYGNIMLTLGAFSGAVLSNDLMLLIAFWGFSGLTLFNLIGCGGPRASDAAKKAFIIVGGTDALMVLGAGIVFYLAKTFDMSLIKLPLDGWLPVLAYLFICIGALAKAGAMPLHSWIPESAAVAPASVIALLPASLDKLLGIYLLARLSLDLFIVIPNSLISIFLLVVGSLTIVIAVLAALVQHDLKKLLSFHAVSQVGYMILGIGTGIPVGIAGGLFHMLNNAIYKCCLFLGAGAVEKEAGTTDLDDLGGLAKVMPVTFASMLIAAASISGIPPLNGFVSKWMIFQGLVMLKGQNNPLWILWLSSAMFGGALTLASFLKVINAIFFGRSKHTGKYFNEAPLSMWLPMALLALLCVVFGVFAFAWPLKYFIIPSVPLVVFFGVWTPVLATALLLIGLCLGAAIYLIGRLKPLKASPAFIGGESIDEGRLFQSGVRFYDTIKETPALKDLYKDAEEGGWDLFERLKKIILSASEGFRELQTGLLHTYLAWCLFGLALLLFTFFFR